MSEPAPAAVPDRPGYLVVRGGGDEGYLGGLMVADHTGLPVDFRFTDPIVPTRLQRALYGGVLDRHLRTEVVARTLVAALSAAPTLLLFDDRTFLDAPPAACPAALVGASAAAGLGPAGTVRSQGGDMLLVQASADHAPVRVGPAGSDSGEREAVVEAIVRLGATMDVLEPLERVREALDLIAAGEVPAEGA